MPKFAINTVLWTWPFTSERLDLLQKAKGFGYQAVELTILDMSTEHVKKIKAEVDRLGLETIICGIPGPDNSLIDPDEAVRQQGIKYMNDLLKLCDALGAKAIVGPLYSTGIHKHVLKPGGREAAEKRFVESFKKIAPAAEAQGVHIAIEPLNRYETNFLNLGSDTLRLIKQVNSPAVGLHLDSYHMNIEEACFAGPIEEAGERLYHLHICENDRGVPGTGTIDWDEITGALKKIGYDYSLSVECCDPTMVSQEVREMALIWRAYDGSPDKIARNSLAFLKQKMC